VSGHGWAKRVEDARKRADVPAVPIGWHSAPPIGTRGTSPRVTSENTRARKILVSVLPTLWAFFIGLRPTKSGLAHIAVQQSSY
jgi:hypothetical protein